MMVWRWHKLSWLYLSLILNLSGVAQQKPPAPQDENKGYVLRIDTTLVTVPVRVLDTQGKHAAGLRVEDFRLLEDGVEQELAFLSSSEKPLTLILMLNVSGLMRPHLNEIQNAIGSLVNQLRPNDRLMLVDIGTEPSILAEATNDREKLREAISLIKPHDQANILEAVYFILSQKMKEIAGRKAIVFFTDGVDAKSNSGRYNANILRTEGVPDLTVTAIQYNSLNKSDPSISKNAITQYKLAAADTFLRDMAQKAGGQVYHANTIQEVKEKFTLLSDDLLRQYTISYYPKVPLVPGEQRKVSVSVSHPDLVARARNPYVSGPSSSTGDVLVSSARESANKQIPHWRKGLPTRWNSIYPEYQYGQRALSFFSGDIAVRLAPLYLHDTKTGSFISLMLNIDPSNLSFIQSADGNRSAVIQVCALAYDGANEPDGAIQTTVTIFDRNNTRRELSGYGKTLRMDLPIKQSAMHHVSWCAKSFWHKELS